MKRRKAIQNIVVVGAATTLLPACNFFQEPLKVYENLPLDRTQRTILSKLSETILPKIGLDKISTPEPTLDFMLTMLNDCSPKADIEKYLAGFDEFQTLLITRYNQTFPNLKPWQVKELMNYLTTSEEVPDKIKYFFDTTNSLTQRHFKSSEYYMKNYLDFEFAPGRYEGCAAV